MTTAVKLDGCFSLDPSSDHGGKKTTRESQREPEIIQTQKRRVCNAQLPSFFSIALEPTPNPRKPEPPGPPKPYIKILKILESLYNLYTHLKNPGPSEAPSILKQEG